ncbi:hypothetical protein MLD38_015489 [Melastoma candidum]|uniref:Uncharacterized protein n=1 Tax=Melastoma candidum TaxID=119954 RepID=A0ACB9RFW9_9MYRT|nr:hypothetical protein MLD38_015489 [Melastoma candidum]
MHSQQKNHQMVDPPLKNGPLLSQGRSSPLLKPSEQDSRIREELELDIETNLEEEIKDGMYNLALRLHRLYLRRKERENSSVGNRGRRAKEGMITGVNIHIVMEGETKVEITKTAKRGPQDRLVIRDRPDAIPRGRARAKKFDWDPGCSPFRSTRRHPTPFLRFGSESSHAVRDCLVSWFSPDI